MHSIPMSPSRLALLSATLLGVAVAVASGVARSAGTCEWQRGKHQQACPAGHSCVVVPPDPSRAACLQEPVGGNLYPQNSVGGKPLFYFPLTGASLASWPWATREGRLQPGNVTAALAPKGTWQPDPRFNSSLRCDGETQVVIPAVPYGLSGALTVALWFKSDTRVRNNNLYQYLFSHTVDEVFDDSLTQWASHRNQVDLFLHGSTLGTLHGLARGILKDSDDGAGIAFLDSDGSVSDSLRTEPLGGWVANTNLSDGAWHHIALSTRPDGSQGFRLFIDGVLAAEMPSANAASGLDNSEVDGGDPVQLTGPITLCGRSDNNPQRRFTGWISQLVIVDASMDWQDISELWREGLHGSRADEKLVQATAPTWYDSTQALLPPATATAWARPPASAAAEPLLPARTGNSSRPRAAASPAAAKRTPPPNAKRPAPPNATRSTPKPWLPNPNATIGFPGPGPDSVQRPTPQRPAAAPLDPAAAWGAKAGQPCSLDLSLPTGLVFCEPGLMCAPVHYSVLLDEELTGVCTQPQPGVLIPTSFPTPWPTPLAYFPLSQGSQLASWPVPKYGGAHMGPSGFKRSSRFGSALFCNNQGSRAAYALLDSVPYTMSGAFAINLWVRTQRAQLNGTGYAYVFSHTATSKRLVEPWGPDQLHVFIPKLENPFSGLSARVVLKDHDDKGTGREGEVWVDTNGLIGNDMIGALLPDSVRIGDGEWHMITVSTFSDYTPGFAVYMDGLLKGLITANSTRDVLNASDTTLQIPGGHPALLGGPVTLCSRSDLDPDRLYTGSVSNLMLFDQGLMPEQIAALYHEYQRQAVLYPAGATPVKRTTAEGGKACAFPVSYGGRLVHDCLYIGGVLQCPVNGTGQLQACALPQDWASTLGNLSGTGLVDGTMLGPADASLPRLTISGQECTIPFTYKGQTYDDCTVIKGSEKCMVAATDGTNTTEGNMQECAPIILRDPDSTTCVRAAGRARAGNRLSRTGLSGLTLDVCVSVLGVDMCSTEEGAWLRCPVMPRIATSGQLCQVPYLYNGLQRTDCVFPSPQASSASSLASLNTSADEPEAVVSDFVAPSCPAPNLGAGSLLGLLLGMPSLFDEGASLRECQPVVAPAVTLQPRFPIRYTLNRQQCIPAGPAALSECLDYTNSGAQQCQVAKGGFFDCAPVQRFGRLSNRSCVFPFTFRGQQRTDCVWVGGVETCKMDDGGWEECSGVHRTAFPEPPPNTTARFTVTGERCSVPFHFLGNLSWGCVGADAGYCRVRQGSWSPCSALMTNTTRTTLGGQECDFPFRLDGLLSYECALKRDGFAGVCPVRGSDNGTAGSTTTIAEFFPSRAGSMDQFLTRLSLSTVLRSVRTTDGKPASLQPCAPPPRRTLAGHECVFPALFNGRRVSDCVTMSNGTQGCFSDKGDWEACTPLAPEYYGTPALPTLPTSDSPSDSAPDTMPVQVSAEQAVQGQGAASAPSAHSRGVGKVLGIVFGVLTLCGVLAGMSFMWLRSVLRRRSRERVAMVMAGTETYGAAAPAAPSTQMATGGQGQGVRGLGATERQRDEGLIPAGLPLSG